MSGVDFVRVDEPMSYSFHTEPAYNALCSLCLLNEDLSGFSPWVEETKAQLTDDELSSTEEACGCFVHLEGKTWDSFPEWLENFSHRTGDVVAACEIDHLLVKAEHLLGGSADLPTPDELKDWQTYTDLSMKIVEANEKEFDEAMIRQYYNRIVEPETFRDETVSRLAVLWERFLEKEWIANEHLVSESVDAFRTLDIADSTRVEIVETVTGRTNLPQSLTSQLVPLEHIIFVPSVHIGPYLLLIGHNDTHARCMMGARIPEGAQTSSPALSRSELITRIAAVSDEARLRILEYVAKKEGASAQDVMSELGMSQSSVSRHLSQLSATGYLSVETIDRAKRYYVNQSRIDHTFTALKDYLGGGKTHG